MKKRIFFDVMGVIFTVGDDTNDLLVPFITARNKTITRAEICKEYMRASLGGITSKAFWERVGLGADYPEIELAYLDTCLALDDECIETLNILSKNYELGIISNDVSEWSAYLRDKFSLNRYFKTVIISGDVKQRKPDKHIFEKVKCFGEDYSDCVFIDDRIKNLVPPAELGFKTILFNRNGEQKDTYSPQVIRFSQIPEAVNKFFGELNG